MTGLDTSADDFLLNGFYKRSGSIEIKEGDKKSGSGNIEITITDVTVNKGTHKIAGGSGKFLLSGSVQTKDHLSLLEMTPQI